MVYPARIHPAHRSPSVVSCGRPRECGSGPPFGARRPTYGSRPHLSIVRERPPEYEAHSGPGGHEAEPDRPQPRVDSPEPRTDSPEPPTDSPQPRTESPQPPPDSPERKAELDALEDLGDEIATLAAHIHAATQRLLVLIAEFDARRGWELGGHRSCAHWLSYRTGINLGAAREKVRTARALTELPETSASMARGELSFSKVRALTRVADADNESELLELARDCTTAQLERVVRAWKRGDRQDEATRERERHERRCLSIFPDDDGMYVVRGKLTPELGALLMRAVEAASDALYREEWRAGEEAGRGLADAEASEEGADGGARQAGGRRSSRAPASDSQRAARQRRADALGLLAERAMAAGFGGAGTGGEGEDGEDAPISGTRAERYQVMLHVDMETLDAEAEPGRSELEDGTRVSAETSRRLACDAAVVRIGHAPDGSVLDVGRWTRTIPPALRRALEVRDRGCRFPGCGSRFTDGHHVRHWADGGETSLANCVLLCRFHHDLVHEGGWSVDWWGEGRPVFFDPRGGTHFEGRWTPPELEGEPVEVEVNDGHPVEASRGDSLALNGDPVETLERDNRSAQPDWRTAGARWKRLEDIPDDVLFRFMEGMDE